MFGAVVAHAVRVGWDTIDLRGGRGFLDGQPPAAQFLVHTLPLGPDEAEVVRAFRPATRRNVRRSERGLLRIERHTSRSAVADYYRLHCGTRRRHGLPPQPWRFFESLQRHVFARGRGYVVLASGAGGPVAGAVFFHFGDTLVYKFGASDRRFHALRPNQGVMWEAIRWGCRNGMRRLDLGRTDPAASGLLQYKTGWGARPERVAYYRYDVRRRAFRESTASVHSSFRLFRLLPAGLLRVTGRLLYRHMG
jgi:lipid II:glycine glycyltransferase (peptidoglycan interpeptide bridge formation enzyme)